MPPIKFTGLDYFWDHFGAKTMFLGGRTEFHMHEFSILHSTGLVFPILCWSCKPHSLQVRLVGLIIRLEEWKVAMRKRFFFTAHSYLAYKLQHVASQCLLCAWSLCVGRVLIGDAKQVMSEGKGGPVETGLTWLATTALSLQYTGIHIHALQPCVQIYAM